MAQGRRSDSRTFWRRATSRPASIGLLFRTAASEWCWDNALRLSAAFSFYAVLSLAPLLVIVIRVMGIAHSRQFASEQITKLTANLMDTQVAGAIKPIIENNGTNSMGYLVTVISTVVILFSATSVFIELQNPQRITIEPAPDLGKGGPLPCCELLSGETRLFAHSQIEVVLPPFGAQVLNFPGQERAI